MNVDVRIFYLASKHKSLFVFCKTFICITIFHGRVRDMGEIQCCDPERCDCKRQETGFDVLQLDPCPGSRTFVGHFETANLQMSPDKKFKTEYFYRIHRPLHDRFVCEITFSNVILLHMQ